MCLTDILTTFGLASKKINADFDDHRPLKCQILKKFFWIAIENLTMLCLCTLTHVCDGNHEDMRIIDSGILLALSLSCGYNFEV